MKWHEKIVVYAALGYTMVQIWDVLGFFKEKINDETLLQLKNRQVNRRDKP